MIVSLFDHVMERPVLHWPKFPISVTYKCWRTLCVNGPVGPTSAFNHLAISATHGCFESGTAISPATTSLTALALDRIGGGDYPLPQPHLFGLDLAGEGRSL